MDLEVFVMPGRTCTQSKNGYHELTITGTPRSAMTYWSCNLCDGRWPRGEGLFHKPPSSAPESQS